MKKQNSINTAKSALKIASGIFLFLIVALPFTYKTSKLSDQMISANVLQTETHSENVTKAVKYIQNNSVKSLPMNIKEEIDNMSEEELKRILFKLLDKVERK